MLYLLEDGINYKVGYSIDETTLVKRINSYRTHNPTFKYLGLRNGTKEDEKNYHKLLQCTSKSEWSCNIDENLLESIKLNFSTEGYIASLFGETIELTEDSDSEIYSCIVLCLHDVVNQSPIGLYMIALCDDAVYIRNNSSSKTYKVSNTNLDIKTFYQDYDKYGELYRGFVINGTVFYEFQISGMSYNPTGNVAMKDSILYKKLTPIMEDFKLELTYE